MSKLLSTIGKLDILLTASKCGRSELDRFALVHAISVSSYLESSVDDTNGTDYAPAALDPTRAAQN